MEEVSSPPPPLPPEPRGMDPLLVAMVATMVVFVAFLLSAFVQLLNIAFGLWFTQAFVFLGVGWCVLRITGREPVRYTRLGAWGLAPAAFGFAVGVANFFGIVAPVQFVSQALLPMSWREIYNVADIFRGQSPVEMALIVGGVGLAAPLCEEFFFRGIFFQGLKARGGRPWKALVLSAVIFSAFHLDPVGFLARVELGVLFGWLLLRTGSLWPAILAHMANNLVSTALFFGAKQAESSQKPTSQQEMMALGVFMLVGIGLLGGLRALAHRFPLLLGGPPRPTEEMEAPEPLLRMAPAAGLLPTVLPWMLAATLSLSAYVVLDPVGIQLSRIDLRYPLKAIPESAPDALHAERGALFELRVRARQGQVPIEAYLQERVRQSKPPRKEFP